MEKNVFDYSDYVEFLNSPNLFTVKNMSNVKHRKV